MSPRGPNEKIIAIAVVNGGDTSGSSTLASIAPSIHRGRRPRAAVNANTKPSTVPTSPTSVRQQQAVPEGADLVAVGQHRREPRQRELALVGQHPREQHRQRVDDEQRQQRPQRERRARDDGDRDARPAPRGAGRRGQVGHDGRPPYGFSTSAIQRSTMRLRLAPA